MTVGFIAATHRRNLQPSKLRFLTFIWSMLVGTMAFPNQIATVGTMIAIYQILTVGAVRRVGEAVTIGAVLAINLIPHTYQHTVFLSAMQTWLDYHEDKILDLYLATRDRS
jgi:hypothetical protein